MATTAVDIVVKVNGGNKLDRLNKSLDETNVAAKRLSQGLKGAIAKVSALAGAAIGLSQAFRTIEQQDFAIAKVKSLGVNSEVLVTRLKEVSKELKGQASVAELTGAAYDVASAGFANAADAAKVLKAASLGATAGFSDINTVANATTSVLNAYGLSADKAGKLVDGFVQTQNDGKIIISEYANNIGKLAPIAASLSVPLEEINGAIAAITANGVSAEIGITGIRSALAKLGANSKEATEILAAYGLEINATTIANEGLVRTLEKLSKISNKEDLLKIVGVEAGQAIAPLLNDLEKLNRLVANQADAFGVAQRGADVASNSIRGALKNIETQFTNLITSGQGVSQILIPAFNGLAKVIEALNGPIGIIVGALGLLALAWYAAAKAAGVYAAAQAAATGSGAAKAIGALATKLAVLGGGTQTVVTGFTAAGASITKTTVAVKASTIAFGALKVALLALPWVAAAAGATALGVAIVGYYQEQARLNNLIKGGSNDLNEYKTEIDRLQSELTAASSKLNEMRENGISNNRAIAAQSRKVAELRSQLEQLEGTYTALIRIVTVESRAIPGRKTDAGGGGFFPFQDEVDKAFESQTKPIIPNFGGGGGKGGGGRRPPKVRESQVPALQRELALKEQIADIQLRVNAAEAARDKNLAIRLKSEQDLARIAKERADIEAESIPLDEKRLKLLINGADAAAVLVETDAKLNELAQARQNTIDEAVTGFNNEVALLQERNEYARDLLSIEQDIARLRKEDPNITQGQIDQYRAAAQGAAAAREEQRKYNEVLSAVQGPVDAFVSGITSGLQAIIDGTKSAEEAFADMLRGIADALIQTATTMIAQYIAIGVARAFAGIPASSPGPQFSQGVNTPLGVAGSGGFGAGSFNLGGGQFGAFAEGGYVTRPTVGLIGEAGEPEYVIPSSKMSTAMARYSQGARGSSVIPDSAGGGGDANNTPTFRLETTVINGVEYATVEQVRAMGQQAARQGAAAGTARTMSNLKNNRSTRSKLGM